MSLLFLNELSQTLVLKVPARAEWWHPGPGDSSQVYVSVSVTINQRPWIKVIPAGWGLQFSRATEICQVEQGTENLWLPTEIYKGKLPFSPLASWGRHSQLGGMLVVSRTRKYQKTPIVKGLESAPNENSLNSLFKYLKSWGNSIPSRGDRIKEEKDLTVCMSCGYLTGENQKEKKKPKIFLDASMDHSSCMFMSLICLNTLLLFHPH